MLVDDKGGVLAGHGRLLAARRLGLKEVPTIALPHLDEAKRRAFMIADNRLAELASWDGARLGLELEGLRTIQWERPLLRWNAQDAAHPLLASDSSGLSWPPAGPTHCG